MFGYALSLLMLLQSGSQPAPKDEIKESLARAEALYFEARFNDSIQLLTRVSEDLQARPDRLPEKVNAKLQLALANIGLNDTEKAKSYLVQMYALDPSTVLDPQQFSPKVIALAGDAKNEMVKARCQAIGEDARKNLKEGNAFAVRSLIGSPDAKCVDMAAMATDAADLLYRTGLEAFKRSDYSAALLNLQAAVKFSPKHELAAQYVELAQGKLQVVQERALIQFQKDFDAQKLADAASDFRLMVALNDSNYATAIRQAGDQYRKALTTLVDKWNQTCPTGDTATMNAIRAQITDLLPEPNFGDDIRSKMVPCNKPEVKAPVRAEVVPEPRSQSKSEAKTVAANAPTSTCLQVDYRVAMTRLKTRVDPDIPREARPYIQGSQVTVRAKIRIDDAGNVTNVDTPGGNPIFNTAVKSAVERWKFSPAMDSNGTRCVDTEIPIVIGPLNSR